MAIITLDYETFYSAEYSLRKMSEVDYILDPRFQTIMCAVKVDDGPTEKHIGHAAVARRLNEIDWTRCAALSHNMRFDGAILAWRYGILPALYLDTLSMARATVRSVTGKVSLAAVSKYLGLPDKGDEVVRAMGKRLEDFTPQELDAYADYCVRDDDNCKEIFNRLRPAVPNSELRLIDTIMRMFIDPQVLLDPEALALHLNDVRAKKAQIMAQVAHIDPSVLSSNIKFAALLESHGVEVPMKISKTTGLLTTALAKNDRAFKELCVDPDQPLEVQAILAARLGVKSTIEETRTESLLNLSLREWPAVVRGVSNEVGRATMRGVGWAPVPLKYYGAHTGRLSGDGGFNWQNFTRKSRIRAGVVAPTGYRIVHRDASQIEARMVAFLAGCQKLIAGFANNEDVYSTFATSVYGQRVTKADTGRRFVGKTSILGLGYECGPAKFRHTLFIGNGGVSLDVDEAEARRIVYAYRRMYPEIPELWERGNAVAQWMVYQCDPKLVQRRAHTHADQIRHDYPCLEVESDALWLPNGMCIAYPGVHVHEEIDPATGVKKNEIVYKGPFGEPRKLYGGKMLENVSQALSRIIVTDIADRVRASTGFAPFLSTHDSLDYCVPESEARAIDDELAREFAVRPGWAQGLPLASEGGWGVTLLDAENMENV